MTATVIPIRQAMTWDAVRERHDRAVQMAEQTVEAFAEIGDMLIELKESTDHGEFVRRCAETFFPEKAISDCYLNQARARAGNYMRLASSRDVWMPKHPKSLRDALKMLPKKKPEEKPYRESWADVLLRHAVIDPALVRGGSEVSVRKKILKADIALPDGGYFDNAAAADHFALAYARAFPQEEPVKHILTKSDQNKVDRAIAIETERLKGLFMQELYAEVDRRIPEITAERQRIIEENSEETRRYRILNATTRKLINADEYRFLIQILHPDRAPAGREQQYAKAIHIIQRLREYAEA